MDNLGAFADPADREFEEVVIAEVQSHDGGHTIKRDDGWSFSCDDGPIVPEPGMQARFYGRGIGFTVRGLVIAGHTFFYRSPEQEEERHRQWVADLKRERAEEYERTKDDMAARLEAYPEVFRKRIERFLSNSPTAWEHQGYEMAVCDATLAIIEHCSDVDAISAWREDRAEVPALEERLAELGLSGNQADMATRLARWWHIEPENIWKDHAAISPLIGCEEAGCPPVKDGMTRANSSYHGTSEVR